MKINASINNADEGE